jgi:hypothetical protein
MIPAALALVAALAAAGSARAQDGGAIRTGEHKGFTRVVLVIDPRTEWSLESAPGRAVLFFPGREIAFGTAGVFDRIPRTRVHSVESATGPDGTRVAVGLGCDCRITASFVGARYLALDVHDRDALPGAATPALAPDAASVAVERGAEEAEARELREAAAVATAEALLIGQIERAADQGLIALAGDPPVAQEPPAIAAPEPDPAPAAETPDAVVASAAPPAEADTLLDLLDHEQIEATTVFDRDSAALMARRPVAAPPPVCLPDEALDVGAWSNGLALHAQTPALMRRVVGEFDRPDPLALRDLVRLHIRFGFGAEAGSLLDSFEADLAERALLADLARAVEGSPVAADGPLALAEPCPGRHGLWLAIGGVAPAFHDPIVFESVQQAFGDLPADLRALVGPGLIGRLLDAGRPVEARAILETQVRPGSVDAGPARALAEARLIAAEGDPLEAAKRMLTIVESGAWNADDALVHFVTLALESDLAIPERVVLDLRAAAGLHRGTPREIEMRRLLVAALGARADLGAALAETRAARAELPSEALRFATLATAVMAAADPDRVGSAEYAEAVLAHAGLIATAPAQDEARLAIAGRLNAIGLPNAALEILRPPLSRGNAAAARIAARAHLDLGAPERALALVAGQRAPTALGLRAEALARGGEPAAALELLAGAGLEEAAQPLAWPSGDWVRASTDPRPERAAMARFMASRAGALPAVEAEPVDGPALSPEEAFAAPLPPLAVPSLAAARSLLATGPQVGGFLGERLAGE